MKNMLCFAVFGCETPSVPPDCGLAFGGFGFAPDGSVRAPYPLPKGSAVLFDDSVLPDCVRPALLQEFLSDQAVETLVFDFERPKTELLCDLIQSVRKVQTVVPPAYAALRHSAVLAPAYHPREPFAMYLQRWQKKERNLVLDLSPVRSDLCGGRWQSSKQRVQHKGCFAAKNQCMYCTERQQNGAIFRFFDTKKTLHTRAASSGLPCIVPMSEYLSLPDE